METLRITRGYILTPTPDHEGRKVSSPGSVYWLLDRPTPRAFPSCDGQWLEAGFVPSYSGGTARDSHPLLLDPVTISMPSG
jgi:hypothetical protein